MDKKTIGLIGCSQLSLYLAQSAKLLKLKVIGLSAKKNDPAAPWCDRWIKGKTNTLYDIEKISALSDFIVFEDKMHFSDVLFQNKKILTKPHSLHLNLLTDLWTLKELLYDFDIPQINFLKINGSDDFDTTFHFFKSKVVFKKRFSEKNKIDTFLINNTTKLKNFKNSHKGIESHFLAEPFTQYSSEHRLILARNNKDQFANYPLFTLSQKNNQYDSVQVETPSPVIEKQIHFIISKFKKMMSQINYEGVLTISLFKIQNELLVYDLDARPTNTGLITMCGFNMNQFDLHLRSIMNLDIEPIHQNIKNIHCQYLISGQKGNASLAKALTNKAKNCQIFIYGKTGKRKNRKLGHVIYTN